MTHRVKQALSSFRSCLPLWSRSYVKLFVRVDMAYGLMAMSDAAFFNEPMVMLNYIADGDDGTRLIAKLTVTESQVNGA